MTSRVQKLIARGGTHSENSIFQFSAWNLKQEKRVTTLEKQEHLNIATLSLQLCHYN